MVNYDEAALDAARLHCGWVVSPEETVTVVVDGPSDGGAVLSLPTRRLQSVSEVLENGTPVDVSTLVVKRDEGLLIKRSGGWARGYGVISVTMTHGFDEAPAFEAAVEQAAISMEAAGARTDTALKRKKVKDVEYEWFEGASQFLNESMLIPYRILPSP